MTAALTGPVSKVYDSTTMASLGSSAFTLSGIMNSDAVFISPTSGTYASANVGIGIGVAATGLSLSGAAAGNYQLVTNYVSANVGTITPKTLTATLTVGQQGLRRYHRRQPRRGELRPPRRDWLRLRHGVFDEWELCSANVGADVGVTATGLSLSGAAAGNYQLSTTSAFANVGTITRKHLTPTLTGPVSKVYDGTTAAMTRWADFTLPA